MGEGASAKAVDAAAKNLFSNFGRSIYCFLRVARMSPETLGDRCNYGGIDTVVARLREKGGFIIVGPHVGPWEMAGAFLSALGLRIHTVALDHPSVRVTNFFDERRRAIGLLCHPMGGSFAALCAALENGECVALLIDRSHGRGGRPSTIFGRSVTLPTGHAALAVRCGVPIVTAVCVFSDGQRFKFVHGGPYYPDLSLDEDDRAEDLQRRCRIDMERFIREYPDQWFHFEPLER
jgi:lauroyl/myristoyl acyltransferase